MRQFTYYLEYLSFRFLGAINNALPIKSTRWIASRLGPFLFRILSKKNRIAMDNLRAALGDKKSENELYRIGEASMVSMLNTGSEFLRIPSVVKNPDYYLKINNIKRAHEALREGKGFILLVAHFGNWETMALPIVLGGVPLSAVARKLSNPFVNRYINTLREKMGLKVIDKDGAVRTCIQELKKNRAVAILIDQHERRGGCWVDFFGREASTSGLPAILALKYGTPVLPFIPYRQEKGPTIVDVMEPLPLIRTGNLEADIKANTQQYVKCIEEVVRKRPEDWLWMHRRWREKPQAHTRLNL